MPHFGKRILIGTLFMLATLIYLEVGVRILVPSTLPLLRTDPEVGSIHVKNFSGMVWDELSHQKHFLKTNAWGYIGESVPEKKESNTIRVAVLGDSVVEAVQVPFYQNFSSVLENTLHTRPLCTKRFEILNFGVGGTGTFSQYQTYKKKVAPLKPDIVVLFFHGDYADNLLKANFDLETYAEQRKSVGVKSLILKFQLPKLLFSKLKNNKLFLLALKKTGLYESVDISPISAEQASIETVTKLPPNFYEYTFTIIAKLNELTKQNGSQLIVAVYPAEQTYSQIGSWKQDPSITNILDFLSTQRIPSLNLAEPLEEIKKNSHGCLTYQCEDHLNKEGHQAIAGILYRYLETYLPEKTHLCAHP